MIPEIPKFDTQKELFTWLRENKEDLIYQKKSAIKYADSFIAPVQLMVAIDSVEKTAKLDAIEGQVLIRAIINTTMVRDSHKDVHIDGLWKKSLRENKMIKHLQEHEMSFKNIIADKGDLRAFTKKYDWKQLGYDAEGKTEALVFDSTVKESRNPVMFKEYKAENVDNHSVGMQYVNLKLALNSKDEDDKAEKETYDKYIDDIVNKAEVKKEGFYFAVLEAKAIEGSAVPIGSNTITPTLTTSKALDEPTEDELKINAIKEWLLKPNKITS